MKILERVDWKEKEDIVRMKDEMQKLLNESGLSDNDRTTVKFLTEAIENKTINEFNDKTFLFEGSPGIGKTHFVEHLVKLLDLPVLFVGPFKFEGKNVKYFKNLKELKDVLSESEEFIVFIDDIQNAIEVERDGFGEVHLSDSEGKNFINILEHIKRSKGRKYLFMTLNDDDILEESWKDRIETRIKLEEPKEKSKIKYLKKKYSKYLTNNLVNEVSSRTMGYNFRDLDELIRLAYRAGDGKITKNSIFESISHYTPTGLEDYNIIHKTNIKFKDIVGSEQLKRDLSYLKCYVNNPQFFKKMGIESSNVIMFAGPPGTGKTFMARALAGEIDIPLVNIDARTIMGRGSPHIGIMKLVNLSRKFRNCIIFVDEIDKFIGNQMLAEDNDVIGHLESEIDGVKKKLQAIVIFAINNKIRFGPAFHDRIPCFNFEYPKDNERREFIIQKIEKSKIPISEEQVNKLVNDTKNRSYRQIEKIWNNIIFKIIERQGYPTKREDMQFKQSHIDDSVSEILGFVQTREILGVG